MDFANRGNKPGMGAPQSSMPQSNEQPTAPSFQPTNKKPEKKSSDNTGMLSKVAAGVMIIAASVLILAALWALVFSDDNVYTERDLINTEKYQAVFLDSQDGQVYFGKLGVFNEDIYALTDIYYVRVEQPIQPEGPDQVSRPNISLAKLGNELHGPEDVMYIRRDKVLYWENLKDEGQVVTAIKNYQERGGEEAESQQQQQQPVGTGTGADANAGTSEAGSENAGENDTDTTDDTTPTPTP